MKVLAVAMSKSIFNCHRFSACVPARICSSHFLEADFVRDMTNELMNLPLRKILKPDAIPTLNLTPEDSNPRKRQAAENRSASAAKRARKEIVAGQKEIVGALLEQHSSTMKDAEVQVNNAGD